MYYVNLGLDAAMTTTGDYQPGFNIPAWLNDQGELKPLGPNGAIINLVASNYWFGVGDALSDSGIFSTAWMFGFNYGVQYTELKYIPYHAWAVRPGDVLTVPEPNSFALFLTGTALLRLGIRKRNLRMSLQSS